MLSIEDGAIRGNMSMSDREVEGRKGVTETARGGTNVCSEMLSYTAYEHSYKKKGNSYRGSREGRIQSPLTAVELRADRPASGLCYSRTLCNAMGGRLGGFK